MRKIHWTETMWQHGPECQFLCCFIPKQEGKKNSISVREFQETSPILRPVFEKKKSRTIYLGCEQKCGVYFSQMVLWRRHSLMALFLWVLPLQVQSVMGWKYSINNTPTTYSVYDVFVVTCGQEVLRYIQRMFLDYTQIAQPWSIYRFCYVWWGPGTSILMVPWGMTTSLTKFPFIQQQNHSLVPSDSYRDVWERTFLHRGLKF